MGKNDHFKRKIEKGKKNKQTLHVICVLNGPRPGVITHKSKQATLSPFSNRHHTEKSVGGDQVRVYKALKHIRPRQ